MDGLVVVDKPAGITSHSVVGRCRRLAHQKRIGHSGTLDPDATGVLLVAFGRATRLIRFLSDLPKVYVCEVVLGKSTSTLDDSGEVTAEWDMSHVTLVQVQAAGEKFVGDIMQVPPMVSALKVDGKRLHQLAREGIEVERKPRPVTIHALKIDSTEEPHVFRLEASCSSGTYVRTLAEDIGTALGGGAHLRRLRRTAIGSFSVDDAVTLDVLEADGVEAHLTSAAKLLVHLSTIAADVELSDDIAHGRKISRSRVGVKGNGPWAVVDADGELMAVYESAGDDTLRAGVVIASR